MKKTLLKMFLAAVFLAAWNITINAQQPMYKTTTEYDQLIDRYFDSLNETAADRRLKLTKQVWTEDATQFVYPNIEAKGYTAISDVTEKVQKQFAGAIVRRSSSIELVRDNYLRFTWELRKTGGELITGGVDYVVIVDGKLHIVTGFFDSDKPAAKN